VTVGQPALPPASTASSPPHQPTARSKYAVVASAVTHGILVLCLGLVSVSDGQSAKLDGSFSALFESDVEQRKLEQTVTLLASAEQSDEVPAGGQVAAFALLTRREPASVFRAVTGSGNVDTESAAWSNADLSQHVAGLNSSRGASSKAGSGTGDGQSAGSGSGNGFFGNAADGRRFVFVLDCSRSMNHPHDSEAKTRFKRLKLELVRSIASMSDSQEFYLVFFSDGPMAMPASSPVPASLVAKQHYLTWMQSLKADGNTNPTEAMQLALRFRPDVIYFLTDGSFTHKTQLDLLRLPFGETKLHTFAFEEVLEGRMLDAYRLLIDGERDSARETVGSKIGFRKAELVADSVLYLKRLAQRHNGTFHLIPHHEP
jgi:hypothetical protein